MNLLGPGDGRMRELLVTLTDRRAPPGTSERFPGSDVYAVDTPTGRRRLLTLDNPGRSSAGISTAPGAMALVISSADCR
jgi:hypothetical protein